MDQLNKVVFCHISRQSLSSKFFRNIQHRHGCPYTGTGVERKEFFQNTKFSQKKKERPDFEDKFIDLFGRTKRSLLLKKPEQYSHQLSCILSLVFHFSEVSIKSNQRNVLKCYDLVFKCRNNYPEYLKPEFFSSV